MKKTILIVAVVILSLAVVGLSAGLIVLSAKNELLENLLFVQEEITKSFIDFEVRELEDGNYEITGLMYSDQYLAEIPDTYMDGKIVGIAENAFSDTSLFAVKLGKNIKYIGKHAFHNATKLCYVEFNNAIESIGEGAFKGCSSIVKINIPDSVTELGSSAFYNCSLLDTVTIGKGIRIIGANTFDGCKITNLTLGESLVEIGESAFKRLAVKDLNLPDSLKVIGDLAFSDSKLETIEGGAGLKSIGMGAFMNSKELWMIELPEGVEKIGDYAFMGDDKIKKITIPSTLKEVGKFAFASGGFYIGDLVMPEGAVIGQHAFTGLTITGTITIKETSNWDNPVLNGVQAQKIILESGTEIPDELFNTVKAAEVQLPSTIKTIGENAFRNAEITNVNISEGVESIGDYAFGFSVIQEIELPSTLKIIGDNAFYSSKLTNIVIPDNVTSIGALAFARSPLNKVVLGSSVNSIGPNAFEGCNALYAIQNKSSLNIEKGKSTYGYIALNACQVTKEDNLGEVISDRGYTYYVYEDVKVLISYVGNAVGFFIPDDVTEIATDFATHSSTGIFAEGVIKIPDSVTMIGARGLRYSGTKTLYLGAGLREIADNSFYPYDLIEIFNRSSIKLELGSSAYGGLAQYASAIYDTWEDSHVKKASGFVTLEYNDENILLEYVGNETNVVVPEGITRIKTIGNEDNRDKIQTIILPNTLKVLESVGSLKNLVSIDLGTSVDTICYSAFDNCIALERITIPASVKSIEYYAFSGCFGLKEIVVDEENTNYCSDGLALYTKDGSKLIAYAKGCGNQTFVINEKVRWIVASIFNNSTGLETITFAEDGWWYRTNTKSDWENKRNGKKINISDPDDYMDYFYNDDNVAVPWWYRSR